jgi:hypothetical protein
MRCIGLIGLRDWLIVLKRHGTQRVPCLFYAEPCSFPAALQYGGTLPDQFMDSRHLPYPPFKAKPMDKLKSLCQ